LVLVSSVLISASLILFSMTLMKWQAVNKQDIQQTTQKETIKFFKGVVLTLISSILFESLIVKIRNL
jgi:uncharacterized membrane protein YidH (DUF202 family)